MFTDILDEVGGSQLVCDTCFIQTFNSKTQYTITWNTDLEGQSHILFLTADLGVYVKHMINILRYNYEVHLHYVLWPWPLLGSQVVL